MTIDLAKVTFINDIFSTKLPDGGTIVLNVVDEDIQSDSLEEKKIKGLNINIYSVDDELIDCPCVIGLGNDIMEIRTDYKSCEGQMLTPDNMVLCTIEIYE